jgi:hypothetical protein
LVVAIAGLLTITDAVRDDGRPAALGQTGPSASTGPSPTGPPGPGVTLRSGPVIILPSAVFASWALLDLRTNTITGSPNLAETSDTASMIKAWLAADYLRRAAAEAQTPSQSRLDELSIMIRDSDNAAAQDIYGLNGGTESIDRLIAICGLTDSRATPGYWSNTEVSARDTARMGACIADGRAAGPTWTAWLLNEMRLVRGTGDFGARLALRTEVASQVAIKNGWLLRSEDGLYHIACLAIGKDWVLGVLTRYPGQLGLEYGQQLCQTVGEQLTSS